MSFRVFSTPELVFVTLSRKIKTSNKKGRFRHKNWFWVPVVGPFLGALIGAWLYQLTIGFHTPQDVEEKYVVLTGNQELKPLTGKE